MFRKTIIMSALIAVSLSFHPQSAGAAPVEIERLTRIIIPEAFVNSERHSAQGLQAALEAMRGTPIGVERQSTADGAGIFIGRDLALSSGLVSEEQLEAVKPDGFVIAGDGDRVAVAGYAEQGTVYGAYTLLRRLGCRYYPWRDGARPGILEIDENRPEILEGLPIQEKPFFVYRDLLEFLDRGPYRTSIRPYVLADPRGGENPALFGDDRGEGYSAFTFQGSDWPDWFHTAAYLVPRDLYYATHPEYFAVHDGSVIPPSRYMRSALCETHPQVQQIAARRLETWMDLQADRSFFSVAPADTDVCECERCEASDRIPVYATDRVLQWVNSIARPVAEKHPDKTIFTAAYLQYVKPPLETAPAENVVVLYAPWFWNSRGTSHGTFEHPLNMIAMNEFMGWTRRFPGQVGMYDYPGEEAFGTAARIKFFARHGVRHIYYNGARGDLLQWLGSELSWDPFQDVDPLLVSYCAARYGAASDPMLALLRLRRATEERHGQHARGVFRQKRHQELAAPASYFTKADTLIAKALELAGAAEPSARLRVMTDVEEPWLDRLLATHPQNGRVDLRLADADFADDLAAFETHHAQVLKELRAAGLTRLAASAEKEAEQVLKSLRTAAEAAPSRALPSQGEERIFDPQAANDKDAPTTHTLAADAVSGSIHKAQFDAADVPNWLFDGSQPTLVAPPEAVVYDSVTGTPLSGVRVRAPLSQLPVRDVDNLQMHVGRFYIERRFDPALPMGDGHWVELYVHASHSVPVTWYVNNVAMDYTLHAGEQIIRFDLRTLDTNRNDFRQWNGLGLIALDIWPQDNLYPHPPARDVELILSSVTVRSKVPGPQELPGAGRVIWLSQFLPTVPHQLPHLLNLEEAYRRQHQPGPTLDYNRLWQHPRFRTFMQHATLSPVATIRVEQGAAFTGVAEEMQKGLSASFGVKLPIMAMDDLEDLNNAVVLGAGLAEACGQVEAADLQVVGRNGAVVRAERGRVVIAGADAVAVSAGTHRYLEDHHAVCLGTSRQRFADLKSGYLHELHAVDRPWFAVDPLQAAPDSAQELSDAVSAEEIEAALELSRQVKALARAGHHDLPEALLLEGRRTELRHYVIGRLIRNPFDDATRAVHRYCGEGVGQ